MEATIHFSPRLFLAALLIGSFALSESRTASAVSDFNSDRVSWDRISVESLAYDDDGERPRGRVVDGRVNVNTFSPENTSVRVDAETVGLRQVFEDLGPIATLWYQHVQTLANPFFEGRVPETRGIELAKEYIEFYLRLYGLEPAFPAPGLSRSAETPGGEIEQSANLVSYRQPFTFNHGGSRMRTQVTDAMCAINGQPLAERDDFVFLGISGSGHVTAPISFVGYGIEDGPDGYTSFDDTTDLSGRIALLLRYEPLNDNGGSKWSRTRFSSHSSMAGKLRNLRERNAAGIILVNPPGARDGATRLETMGRSSQFGPTMTVPVVQITGEAAERILKQAAPGSGDLMAWRRKADIGEVRTVHLDGVQVTLAGEVTRGSARAGIQTENVGAILRGRGSLADEWIVIGAHLDHVGYGQFGASPRNRGRVHPGADDNASGTAGLLILARTLSEKYATLSEDADLRSILFIGFSAEESGLHGSRHFVNEPSIDAESISIMINMDMIGRLRDGTVSAMGTGTAEGLGEVLRPHFERSGLTVHTTPASSNRSDDASFIRANIPAIHFFTGMHSEYHAPEDQAYTVNPAGARDILRLLHHLTVDLAQRPQRLIFTTPRRAQAAPPDRGYAPVRLGIQPGMSGDLESPGVLIEAVLPGLPAEGADIRTGDVIIEWGGESLNGMAGLVENLRKHQPGDEVTLTIVREGEVIQARVKFPASND